ncbi:WXG100 family type VII secretion target [Bowdeniella massiliensis]|uniref:WXG100 family type VII secretion target n=1 Tax=Bowdeniella massiliensis TaxID=2932264 RepID=UPI002029859C|nr:WXG100 family type VII secretion target [Bowdeniella massiliensis]
MQLTVNSTELQASSARTTASVSSVRAEVHALMANLQSLQGSWSGAASDAFGDCARRWHLIQQQVEVSLEEISQALTAAARQYEDVEAASRAMFAA